MFRNKRTTLSCMIVLLFGVFLFHTGTDGFRAFTEESARMQKLKNYQPQFPDVLLEDSKGRTYPFSEFEGKYVFITFFYTSCVSVCPVLELNMKEVYEAIPPQYMGGEIVFLSISFDPARDDPAVLERYRTYFESDGETWRMARIPDQSELDALLKEFGVIVIPDNNGNFAHNSAFYVVDREGRLIEVMDYTKVEEAAAKMIKILETETGV